MKDQLVILVLTTIANLILGLAVWLRSPSQRVNRYFGIFSASIATWTISNGLVHSYAASPWGIMWARAAFASASIIPLSLFLFVSVFPSPRLNPSEIPGFLWSAAGLSAFLLSFTPLIAQSTASIDGILKVSYGPLHLFFGTYFLCCLSHSLFLLAQRLRVLKGLEKLQVRYVFLGISLSILGGTITNLIIPLVFHSSRFSPYGPLFGIFMIAMTAHAIVRHRLMNMRLVLRRGVVWILAVATAGGVFVSLLGLLTALTFGHSRDFPLWLEVSLVLAIALLFQPVRHWIQTSFDRYLYREYYDYQHIIREASKTIGTLLDLQPLLRYVCEVIGRTVRPEAASIFVWNHESAGYKRMAFRKYIEDKTNPELDPTLSETSPLAHLLAFTRSYFLPDDDDVEHVPPDDVNREALKELRRLGGSIAFPILHEEQLLGLIILAPKLSGDAYFAEDIDLLSTLIGQAAIAMKNAQLYQEVTLVNEYVANIVATMESGVIAVGANGRVTLFNPAAERMTGLSAQSVRSGLISSLPLSLAQALKATLADGQSRIQPETTIPDATGRLTPISYSTYLLRDRSGTALGAVAVFADLTRLKELEGERRRAERLASFGALASGIAHEIKNPLVAIKTFAELLPERFAEEDFREDFSKVVVREIDRIDDLVARLRGLAAPSTHPLAPMDLREPIEDTLALLRAQLEQKGIRLHRSYDPVIPSVAGDPAHLKQLFLNLFMNALEAMEPGGELTIDLRARSKRGTSTILARVSDTGSGIPEALLGKIFDPFVTTKSRGSGLGLAICRRITDAHGATIRAENNARGRGSTISIEFPAVSAMVASING